MLVTSAPRTEIDMATGPAFLAEMREANYAISRDHVLVLRGVAENCLRLFRICDPEGKLTIEP